MATDRGGLPLPPGSTIGILGGGQLGRMMALAAARLGLRCHIFAPAGDNPAFDVAAAATEAPYEDEAALDRFALSIDAVTLEFENVPLAALTRLAARVPAAPGPEALRLTQDRLAEKTLADRLGIGVPAFRPVSDLAELQAAIEEIGTPSVLKTRRLGYDGKGQAKVGAPSDAASAWKAIGAAPAILEAFVPFAAELSVIAARGRDGHLRLYDPVENVHRSHVLHTSTVPARIAAANAEAARGIAGRIAEALDYVGVLAVELFLLREGGEERLLLNEIAPRVHNSGHWTIEACLVSQFEQHMRAVAGWPLGDSTRHSDAVMTNLIGQDAEVWWALAAEPAAALHLYGKREVRPGRKMGHVTRISPLRS